jgi:hypothetical protein
MIQVIFIPVLFVCMNNNCEFVQAMTYYTREAECRSSLEAQKDKILKMAAKANATVTLIEGACATAKNGLL